MMYECVPKARFCLFFITLFIVLMISFSFILGPAQWMWTSQYKSVENYETSDKNNTRLNRKHC